MSLRSKAVLCRAVLGLLVHICVLIGPSSDSDGQSDLCAIHWPGLHARAEDSELESPKSVQFQMLSDSFI